ncbi:putative transcription factor interactor and regulator CCHC(Zn) family [Helianthus annuus]|nr:putative transcription factor interactor and regulator CCHC(Zn) family [Helianthus annuus]KAJ0701087.1 putative transcription factor interactor and regulator CCHC(Zn) family [Helianthus annuus]
MEQIKISRMKVFDGKQDIGLYYKAGLNEKTNMSPKAETTFNVKSSSGGSSKGSSSKTSFSSYPSFDPNLTTTKNGRKLQCNIVLNLEDDQDYTEEVAKSHMSLLGTVLESYGSFVAGRIGNPTLTKEDYDQIDAEEMELIDIKWCLASVLRRAEKFKQITGRDDLRETNISTLGFDKFNVTCFHCREKGHFKRECTNREASGAQNPFNNNDYYRKAIYHQVAQQPNQQQPQMAHGRNVIEESSKRACMVNQDEKKSSTGFNWDKYISADGKACVIDQDDEKLPEGFSWGNFSWDDYDPNKTQVHTAFVARIEEDSDDDTEYYAKRMRDHLKMMAESDSEDDNAKNKKKKVKTPVSSDDEEIPVVKRKVKEVPKFKINEDIDAREIPVNCETCEIMKKKNSELINNMNRLKESYDVLNKAMNMYNETSDEQATAMKTLQGAFMMKQKVVNNYIAKCDVLEQKLELQRIETERVNRLLKSYSCTYYAIDRIYPTVEGMKAFEDDEVIKEQKASEKKISEKKNDTKKKTDKKNSGKKQGVSYNKCPPSLENGYLPRNPNSERVQKATNLQWESEPTVNLPENIDITFTSSDTDHESELIKNVVDQVLEKDESEEFMSESRPESKSESDTSSQISKQGKRVYNKEFLLSKSNLDGETFKVAYTLNDSDKLYSDEEFPIRGVKTEMIKKVFKLTEINISEIKDVNLTDKPKKYTSRVQQRENKKKVYSSGFGYRKKPNHNNNFKKKGLGFIPPENHKNEKYVRDFKSKMFFVSGTFSEEEKEKLFRK